MPLGPTWGAAGAFALWVFLAAFPVACGERQALAALVVSGHKAVGKSFVQQSACATLTMVASARATGGFRGDAYLMAGPLGSSSPHDRASWRSASGWEPEHRRLVRELDGLLRDITVLDLVPLILSDRYPFMRLNLNYMKLAVYCFSEYDKVMFIDLDVVIIEPLAPFFDLLRPGIDLVGYRTCTAPVNSGFFLIRPDAQGANSQIAGGGRGTRSIGRVSRRLTDLSQITMRNECPCPIVGQFRESGYNRYGSTAAELRALWARPKLNGSRPSRKLCSKVLDRTTGTWELAGAGTGQGLMWYYYGLQLRTYVSLTYDELPIVHYNSPGPKPWSASAAPFRSDVTTRQHCDFVWWRAHLAARRSTLSRDFAFCEALLEPRLAKKRAAAHFGDAACCRSCPGGGHFATAQRCAATAGLGHYESSECRVVEELFSPLR